MITAFNVLAHTDRVHRFLDGINRILGDSDAIFVSQSHYLPDLLDRCEYDTVYHEHARYYTLTSLAYLFALHGLHIYDVEMSEFYGGSFITYASKKASPLSERCRAVLGSEARFRGDEVYVSFARRVMRSRQHLRSLLAQLKSEGKKVVGVGAPMKSSTLLNYCSIDSNLLKYLTEVNPLKIGTFSPGTHIPVVSEERLIEDGPDVAMILSWNVADMIMKKLREKGFTGTFLIPVPEPRLIT